MADESKTVGYCAYSGQPLKGKQLREGGFHTTSDGVTHRLVRWAERRYEWVGDKLRHKVTKRPFDIHPNAKADAALAPQIEEHADPNEPKKARKSKKTAAEVEETPQPITQDAPPAEDDVPNVQPAAEPESDGSETEATEPVVETEEVWGGAPAVEFEDEDVIE